MRKATIARKTSDQDPRPTCARHILQEGLRDPTERDNRRDQRETDGRVVRLILCVCQRIDAAGLEYSTTLIK